MSTSARSACFAAERGTVAIAVEVKSFLGLSEVRDLEIAVGQFVIYERLLRDLEPRRQLFLAVPEEAWDAIFAEMLGRIVIDALALRILIVNPDQEVIVQWFPSKPGETPSSAS